MYYDQIERRLVAFICGIKDRRSLKKRFYEDLKKRQTERPIYKSDMPNGIKSTRPVYDLSHINE